ncbi:MAG: N-acetyltransferase [Pseudomonadales bacterium]|nr:N-acetyltransferase [Pseudomonadales bacterium]
MNLSLYDTADTQQIINFYTEVFSHSEGEEEGKSIGNLVANLISTTGEKDLIGCVATDNGSITGCIFFSRFVVPNGQTAFILSPVAISTDVQGSGVGQQLINYGLNHLRSLNVDLVFTYGDPAYYCKTGFKQIDESIVKAPFMLSQPIGWMAQSLNNAPVPTMKGDTQCVMALSDQKYW